MSALDVFKRKVAGIPVAYLALGGAVILAVVAWQMKEAPSGDSETTDGDGIPSDAEEELNNPYDRMDSGGTVVVSPTTPEKEEEKEEETNEDWLRKAISYLMEKGKATPGDAQQALIKYLNGQDMSYQEGQLRDEAIKGVGLPPEIPSGGTTAGHVAKKQFTTFPGRHTVTGPSDNTFRQLAKLYHNLDDKNTVNLLEFNNYQLRDPIPVGTVVAIPRLTQPVYYTAVKGVQTASAIAAKNGVAEQGVIVLNDGMKFPVNVGTRVRVR